MPRFFFDTIDTGRAAEDDDGTELASLEVAKREALATLGEIAHDELHGRIEPFKGGGAPA